MALLACKQSKSKTESTASPVPVASAKPDAAVADLGAEFKEQLEPRFEAIEKVGGKLPARITRGYLKLDKDAVLGDTAEYIHAEDMWKLTYPPTEFQTYRVSGSGLFLSCARVIRDGDTKVTEARAKLERCAKAEYLVVIRTKKLDEPKSHNGLQFIGGKGEGDVLVYSLPEMKLLGGYPWKAQSSERAHPHKLDEDMQRNLAAAMKEGLKKLHPESKLHFVM